MSRPLLPLLLLCACASPPRNDARVAPEPEAPAVLERAPGFDHTPEWVDGGSLFIADGALFAVGRVQIPATARRDAGIAAADSYARAELAAFITSTVSSWFLDIESSTGERTLAESLTVESRLVTGSTPIDERYWERRRGEDGEVWLLASRAEFRLEDARLIVDRTGQRAETDVSSVLETAEARWARIEAEVQPLERGTAPAWAREGDRIEAGHHLFVCSGHAASASTAESLARSRCAEKLCRLFGVEIAARVEVNESLESISVERSVSERCPSIRAVQWQTRYEAGECGPSGCTKWLLQSYPVVEYERERERLASPTILERTVVVQDGEEPFANPEQCEDLLKRYGAVEGRRSSDYATRAQHLKLAAVACGRIDPRETGLFERMNALLTQPIAKFTAPQGRYGVSHLFAAPPAGFLEELQRKRFLTDRIAMVERLVRGAVIPLRAAELYDDRISDLTTIDQVIAPLLSTPFVPEPVLDTHAINWHEMLAPRLLSDEMPMVPSYRSYLLNQALQRDYDCWAGSSVISSRTILEYFVKDGMLDADEWSVAQSLVLRATRSRHLCWGPIFEGSKDEKLKEPRIRWALEQIKERKLAFTKYQDSWDGFEELMVGLDEPDMYRVFLREYDMIEHSERQLAELAGRAASYLTDIDRKSAKTGRKQCLKMAREMDTLVELGVQERRFEGWLCFCLGPDVKLDPRARLIIERKLRSLSYYNCKYAPRRGT